MALYQLSATVTEEAALARSLEAVNAKRTERGEALLLHAEYVQFLFKSRLQDLVTRYAASILADLDSNEARESAATRTRIVEVLKPTEVRR